MQERKLEQFTKHSLGADLAIKQNLMKSSKPSGIIVSCVRTFSTSNMNSGIFKKVNRLMLITRDSKSRLTIVTMTKSWPEAVKTEMIRDKFVFSIRDDHLKECLLRETDISLHKLVGLAQRTESSNQHIKEMTGHTTKPIDAIHEQREFMCGQCGYKHRHKECPAFGRQFSLVTG